MARIHVTIDGDMLDLICYRAYRGRQSGAVEAVLEANRNTALSERPERLPRGLRATAQHWATRLPWPTCIIERKC